MTTKAEKIIEILKTASSGRIHAVVRLGGYDWDANGEAKES